VALYDDGKIKRLALTLWARFYALYTRIKKTKLDKNNCRIRLRGGIILYNNDTNKRNDVRVTGKIYRFACAEKTIIGAIVGTVTRNRLRRFFYQV